MDRWMRVVLVVVIMMVVLVFVCKWWWWLWWCCWCWCVVVLLPATIYCPDWSLLQKCVFAQRLENLRYYVSSISLCMLFRQAWCSVNVDEIFFRYKSVAYRHHVCEKHTSLDRSSSFSSSNKTESLWLWRPSRGTHGQQIISFLQQEIKMGSGDARVSDLVKTRLRKTCLLLYGFVKAL